MLGIQRSMKVMTKNNRIVGYQGCESSESFRVLENLKNLTFVEIT